MHLAYLAFTLKSDNTPWWVLVIAALVIGGIAWGIFVTFIGSRETKIRGPALTGTARVVSVRTLGAVGDPQQGGQRAVGRVHLRVEVPGREPYDATARQNFRPWAYDSIQVGRTVAVQVDSTNPQKVRIDLSRPITEWQVQSPSAPTEFVTNIADQIKAAVEEQFEQPTTSGSFGTPPTVAEVADAYKQTPAGVGQFASGADLLASGQRVQGVLRSFAATGTTLRSLGRTSGRPELLDAPQYVLQVELRFPNLAPVQAQNTQSVPLAQVPTLAIGLELACAVDPADPSHRFVIDWSDIAR